MSKNARRTQRYKAEDKPPVKEKFIEAAKQEVVQIITPKFIPATDNQKLAVAELRAGKNVVILCGSAGTGKSLLASWWAAHQMKLKLVDKVWLLRPPVPTGKTIGLLKGSEEEKLLPYFIQTITHLETFMGQSFVRYCLDKGRIEMKAMEYLRGYSFQDCIVIIEEAQNCSKEDMEMILTRLGKNATLIFTGDQKQHDLRGESGLEQTAKLITKVVDSNPDYLDAEDMKELSSKFGLVRFTPEDVVRSGLTKAFVKMYHNNG